MHNVRTTVASRSLPDNCVNDIVVVIFLIFFEGLTALHGENRGHSLSDCAHKSNDFTEVVFSYHQGVIDCVFRTVAEEGWVALLKGISPRVTFIGIGGGVFFFSLEGAKDLLGVK